MLRTGLAISRTKPDFVRQLLNRRHARTDRRIFRHTALNGIYPSLPLSLCLMGIELPLLSA
jgi:hypothetical protein